MEPATTCRRRDWAWERLASKRPEVDEVADSEDAAEEMSEARDSRAAKSSSFHIAAV